MEKFKYKKISIIGCGNLGSAILKGFLNKGMDGRNFWITRNNLEKLNEFKPFNVNILNDNSIAVKDSEIIILGVKPNKIEEICLSLKDNLSSNSIIISLAAGKKIDFLNKFIGNNNPIFRLLGNIASRYNSGMTFMSHNNPENIIINEIKNLFELLGRIEIVDDTLMDVCTVVSPSGIAYALKYIEATQKAGEILGLSSELSLKVSIQTMKGALKLLENNNSQPKDEIIKVTTPKGCTIEGMKILEQKEFNKIVEECYKSCFGVLTSL